MVFIIGVLNIQAQNFQSRSFVSAGEFGVGKQRAITTKAALSAERVC